MLDIVDVNHFILSGFGQETFADTQYFHIVSVPEFSFNILRRIINVITRKTVLIYL